MNSSLDLDFAVAPLSDWKKYRTYDLTVDHAQDDKAQEIKLSSLSRPHMRIFHCAWFSVFVSFFAWFAISPLLSEIQQSLALSKEDIWTSSIAGVCGTVIVRFILGPLCDSFGARKLMAVILCLTAIPTACIGFVQTGRELVLIRLCISIAGGTFVMSQYWTTSTFILEIIGTANGLAGGWGNLGAGTTNIIIGTILFPLLKLLYDGDSEMAWRTVFVFPALLVFCTGIMIYYLSDDTPKGNISERRIHGCFSPVSPRTCFLTATRDVNTWILFIQYGCCFGVQLTMNNAAAMYFRDEFGLSTESAAAIASIFSWMLLFARALGGFASDMANYKYGMQGRLVIHTVLLICEGGVVALFGQTKSLASAICVMIIFSLFVDGATGSTYAIVPYVNQSCAGSVIGVVAAGGNVGAAIFGLFFQQLPYEKAFLYMGLIAIASGFFSIFIRIDGQSTLLRNDSNAPDEDKEDAPLKPGDDKERVLKKRKLRKDTGKSVQDTHMNDAIA